MMEVIWVGPACRLPGGKHCTQGNDLPQYCSEVRTYMYVCVGRDNEPIKQAFEMETLGNANVC